MKRGKVLIIDDDKNFLKTTKEVLEKGGFDTFILDDPKIAENIVADVRPDVMILDILMPQRSGFDIVDDFEAMNIYKNIPKIFLTVMDDDDERLAAGASGVREYLAKPFEPEELIKTVRLCLLRKRLSSNLK